MATDEVGCETVTQKDAHGRLVETVRQLGGDCLEGGSGTPNRMTLAWDTLDRLVEVKDHPGNTWSALYDTLGRRVAVTDPDHGTWTFAYDRAGRLLSQLDANAAATLFTYDANGRVTLREHRSGGLSGAGSTITSSHVFGYDETRTVDGVTYWNGHELSSTTSSTPAEGASPWATTRHDHDANGLKVWDTWTLRGVTYWQRSRRDADGSGSVCNCRRAGRWPHPTRRCGAAPLRPRRMRAGRSS